MLAWDRVSKQPQTSPSPILAATEQKGGNRANATKSDKMLRETAFSSPGHTTRPQRPHPPRLKPQPNDSKPLNPIGSVRPKTRYNIPLHLCPRADPTP